MKWRMKEKDLLCESEVQVFALNLDGTENVVERSSGLTLNLIGNEISHME